MGGGRWWCLALALGACTDANAPCDGGLCAASPDAGRTSIDCLTPARIEVSPRQVDFGVTAKPASLAVSVSNPSACPLAVHSAAFAGDARLSCPKCGDAFPGELAPMETRDLDVVFEPSKQGLASGTLTIKGVDSAIKVAVRAQFLGTLDLEVAPSPVDFGYVPLGSSATRTVNIGNGGASGSTLTIQGLGLEAATSRDFALLPVRGLPRALGAVIDGTHEVATAQVRFTPSTADARSTSLRIATSQGEASVPVLGSAAPPAIIVVEPQRVEFAASSLGATKTEWTTVSNRGGSTLEVTPRFANARNAVGFSISPDETVSIEPGDYLELAVGFTPTQAQAYNAILLVESNAPAQPSIAVPLSGSGLAAGAEEFIKIEMTYENGDDTAFDDDLRQATLVVDGPPGGLCSKAKATKVSWGAYGNCLYSAYPPKTEPQQAVLASIKRDGVWTVRVAYEQDCASAPTNLVALILGTTVDVLQKVLNGAVVVPGKDVNAIISKLCVSHARSNADVRVWIAGRQVAERSVTVGKTGDVARVVEVVRSGGVFSVR